MLARRSRRAVDVLRFAGGALDTFAHDEPDRKHVRNSAFAASTNKGQWQPRRLLGDGVQTGRVGVAQMAGAERGKAIAGSDLRRSIHRRRKAREGRRLIRLINEI